jgi:hypothetical protein
MKMKLTRSEILPRPARPRNAHARKRNHPATNKAAGGFFTGGRLYLLRRFDEADFDSQGRRVTLKRLLYSATTRKPTLLPRVEGKKRKRAAERQLAAGENHEPPRTIRDWSKTFSSSFSS